MIPAARIRLKPLAGPWEVLGSDRLRGLAPEGIEAASDSWGPSTLNFNIKAEKGGSRPDILPFTPVELEVGGLTCWTGFVWIRPTDDNDHQVTCRGWQYHLDDDLLDRAYVHTKLADYVDLRSLLTTTLGAGACCAAGQVSNDAGILLALPNGTAIVPGTQVGVILDLGPDSTATRVVVTASTSFNAALRFYVIGHDDPWYGGDVIGSSRDDYVSAQLINGAPWTAKDQQQTFATTNARAHRYITILLFDDAITTTLAADVYIRIHSLKAFRSASYESGGASILKSSDVISDVLSFAPLLSQRTGLITAGTFSIPSYLTDGYINPRSVMEAVNVVENYRLKLGGEKLNQLVYDPKPTTPIVEVGQWSGYHFQDATVTGESIFDGAVLDGTGPDNARLVSERSQTGTLVDRRGFHRRSRVDVNAAVTSAVADRINDLWLTEHRTAPFSGTLTFSGPAAARRVQSGLEVSPHTFLLFAGERIRMSNRVDPDTGKFGRDGRIAGVTYKHDAQTVELAIDEQRQRFDTILARYAELVGG